MLAVSIAILFLVECISGCCECSVLSSRLVIRIGRRFCTHVMPVQQRSSRGKAQPDGARVQITISLGVVHMARVAWSLPKNTFVD